MYIRRKVFSLLQDENGEERYFSTTEFEDERLYAESDDDEKSGRGKKAAIIGGAAVAPVAVAGGYQLVRRGQDKRAQKALEAAIEEGENEKIRSAAEKVGKRNKVDNFGDKAQGGVKKVVKGAGQWIKGKWTGEGNKRIKQVIDEESGKVTNSAYKYLDSKTGKALTEGEAAKLTKKIGNRNKALMIATPVVTTGGVIAGKRIAKNRKAKKSED